MLRSAPNNGFTLIEMLVALAIFALLSAAGVTLLQGASNTQLVVAERLDHLGANSRAIALMEADLAQAITRPVRYKNVPLPAFVAQGSEASGQLFAVTRTGWSNLDNAPRPDLQRVVYAIEQGDFVRLASSSPDDGAMQKTRLFDKMESATLRFRDSEGNWRSNWDATDKALLPQALELVIKQQGVAPVRVLFLVGTGLNPTPVDEQARDNDAPQA